MNEIANQLPTDTETLHALVMTAWTQRDAAMAERDRALSQIDRLRHLLRQLSRAHFGKRSEKLDPEELPHAPIPNAAIAAKAAAVQICRLRLLSMLPLDPNPPREVTFLIARPRIARIAGCGHVDAAEHGRRMNRAVILSAG